MSKEFDMANAKTTFHLHSDSLPDGVVQSLNPHSGQPGDSVEMETVTTSKKYLSPIFDDIPAGLKIQNRWILWKGEKTPFDAKNFQQNASSTDSKTWASYDQAAAVYDKGGFNGIAFVLAGDGIVGIDLDTCVIDGVPNVQAMNLMEQIGCQYIELSPSGTGLRAFGYVADPPLKGVKAQFNGIAVELYSTKRFLTVTGHVLKSGPIAPLPGYKDLRHALRTSRMTEDNKDTEDIEAKEKTEGTDFSYSAPSVEFFLAYTFPATSIPDRQGQRSSALFWLARDLKIKFWDTGPNLFKPLVERWHQEVLPVIGTKDFRTSWTDFCAAWLQVEHPAGKFDKVVAGIDAYPIDNPGKDYAEGGDKLYQLCIALQAEDLSEPFFLGCREAGHYIGTSHDYAARLLKAFVSVGLLELVEVGKSPSNGKRGKATRYRVPSKQCVRV